MSDGSLDRRDPGAPYLIERPVVVTTHGVRLFGPAEEAAALI